MKAATQKLTRRLAALILVLVLAVGFSTAAWAEGVPRREAPVYKVAFYAANCYHVQDENGRRRGYGYEMMQGLSKYMQCTFDYVGYDKTPAESMEMLRPLADKKAQTMALHCDKPDCVVVGDVNRYSQIMLNIISNAIKYTPVGGEITVRLDCLPGGQVIFRCTDTGIGMTPEFIGHITEDYVRAEDSRVSKVQGTGLGMSVVKGFTDLMGGTLDMYSHEGHGSTFVVSIPFAEADDAQRAAVLAPHKTGETTADFTGKRVLLAEDNALNAEIAVELLQSIGLKVDWAEDGQKAVEMFEKSAPGSYFAVFMDMQMPVMDGVEATRRIRASDRPDHDVPIFAMTANTFAADRKKCYDAGMSGYIPKPIDLETITHVLEEETGE